MVDKVKPFKMEHPASGGTETDKRATELNEAEDYVSVKGIAFEGLDSRLTDLDGSGNIQYKDANSENFTTNVSGYVKLNTLAEHVYEQQTGLRIGEYSYTAQGGMVLLAWDLLSIIPTGGTFEDFNLLQYGEI